MDYLENGAGRMDSRDRSAEFANEFLYAERVAVAYEQRLRVHSAALSDCGRGDDPGGGYDWQNVRVSFNSRPQRPAAANLVFEYGTLQRAPHHLSRAPPHLVRQPRPVAVTPRFALEPTCSLNTVGLVQGSFAAHLAGSGVIVTMSPRMFAGTLVQYNSGSYAMTANARFRWEYQPGSVRFIVYNDERIRAPVHSRALMTRSFVVKINRLFRF